MPVPSTVIVGTLVALEVLAPPDALPRTRATLRSDGGPLVDFVVPGANGGPPAAVVGVPILAPGQRWRLDLVPTPAGLVPAGLGEGMTPVDACTPVWNLNGLRYGEDQLPFAFQMHEEGCTQLGPDTTEAELVAAAERWNGVGCSTFRFRYDGRTALGTEDDGVNVVRWENGEWEWGDDVAGMSMTRFGVDADGEPIPIGSDMLYNGVTFEWTTGPGNMRSRPFSLNAGSVISHEMGHVVGLDHEYDLVTSTLFYAYIGGDWMASLAGDDRRAACENYPTGSDECVDDGDCAAVEDVPRSCVEIDGIRVCDEDRDPLGAACSLDWFNCASLCVFTDRMATDGYCSQPCPDGTCPDGFHCGEASILFPDPETGVCLVGDDTGLPAETGETGSPPADTGDGDIGKTCGCATARPGTGAGAWALLALLLPIGRRPARRTGARPPRQPRA